MFMRPEPYSTCAESAPTRPVPREPHSTERGPLRAFVQGILKPSLSKPAAILEKREPQANPTTHRFPQNAIKIRYSEIKFASQCKDRSLIGNLLK